MRSPLASGFVSARMWWSAESRTSITGVGSNNFSGVRASIAAFEIDLSRTKLELEALTSVAFSWIIS